MSDDSPLKRGIDPLQADGLQRRQGTRDEIGSAAEQIRLKKSGRWSAALPVAVASEGSWQFDESAGLQLQQQRAYGHVLEAPGLVAPLPRLGQMHGELLPRPVRMLRAQRSNTVEISFAQLTSLHTNRAHAPELAENPAASSAQYVQTPGAGAEPPIKKPGTRPASRSDVAVVRPRAGHVRFRPPPSEKPAAAPQSGGPRFFVPSRFVPSRFVLSRFVLSPEKMRA